MDMLERTPRNQVRERAGWPSSLPVRRDRLIGRERELALVAGLLVRDEVGLVTLTGAGGSGKTRLAIELAADLRDRFADGVCFVPLAPVLDPALVVSAVAQALGVHEAGDRTLAESLTAYLREKRMLLVLDNFEHLLSAATVVADLLTASRDLTILVSSRAVLHVSGEHEVMVPPLGLPRRSPLPTLARLTESEAVRLFVERARAARPEFRLTDQNAPAVAEICHRLDGLPLALELAAARTRLLPPEALLARLDRRLPLLTGGPRDLPVRHQTLRATLAWSYDLLNPAEQALFRTMAAFVGGCSLTAIERVGSGQCAAGTSGTPASSDPPSSTGLLDVVASLLGKSLLRQEHLAGEPRLTMLETIREYGLEQLEASGEAGAVRERHAAYFLGLAEAAEPNLLGPDQAAWLARLDREHDNIRTALTWSRTAEAGLGPPPAELGLRLAGALQWFWYIRCHLTEGRRWLEPMLSASDGLPAGVRAGGLVTLGRLMQAQGEYVVSAALFEEGAALYGLVNDRRSAAFAIGARGQNAMAQADYDLAISRFEESLAVYRAEDDRWGIGWTLGNLGRTAQAQGEHQQAVSYLDESLRLKREVGDPIALGLGLGFRGRAAYAMREYPRATALFEESLRLFREVGHPRGIGTALYDLGRVARATGSNERAAILQAQSLQVQREEGYRLGIAECLEGLAGLCAERALAVPRVEPASRERLRLAARLFGASEALREVIAAPMPPVDRAAHESTVALVRTHLGPELRRFWESGRAVSLEEAIDEALAFAEHAPPRVTPSEPSGVAGAIRLLSSRERDVAHLIARGYSNPQISTELMITRRTVESHVTTILSKLGLSSRTQLALWAVEHGLSSSAGGP